MRRKDRKIINKKIIEQIIQQADVCRIALVDNDKPYVVPMNFGYVNNTIYLHSAKVGKKIDLIKQNHNVCFEMDVDHKLIPASATEPSQCTMHYKSVIGFGKAHLIENADEKLVALNALMQHYGQAKHQKADYGKFFDIVQIIRIDIESMSGKINS